MSTSNATTVPTIENPVYKWLARIIAVLAFGLGVATVIVNSIFVYDIFTNPDFTGLQTGYANLGINGTLFSIYFIALYWIRVLIFLVVAGLILLRRVNTVIGLLVSLWMIGFGVTLSNSTTLNQIQLGLEITQGGLSFNLIIITLSGIMATLGWLLLSPALLLYPNGKLQPRWSLFPIVTYFFVSLIWGFVPVDSPYHPVNVPLPVTIIFTIVVWGTLLVALWVRYRRYFTVLEKQQAKWLIYSFTIFAILFLATDASFRGFGMNQPLTSASVIGDAIGIFLELGSAMVPVSIGLALFRYRLWDIDLVINRSLVYGAILGVALATFFAVLFGLQLLGSTQPILALAISIIVTILLYNPLRTRIQHFVDHRIYGLRYGLDEVNRLKDDSKPSIETRGSLTGESFGNYELLDLLGKGGMGEVYKAYDGANTVAIKILNVDMSTDSDMRRRFEREAIAGMKLDHPHLVKVHEVREHNGYYYMVMDFIDGQDLRKEIKQYGALDIETALTIIRKLCDALTIAHAQNYVHRDIKPANIMLRSNGDPILMDFGIAKLRDGRTVITKTGAIGTIDYMAPEQVMEAKEVDSRADIYALGIVLFEMLTGERPFNGSPAQVMFAHIQQPAPDVRDLNPDIPRHIAKAIERTLEKVPDNRYQSVGELAGELLKI